jgi:hypothetical protein
MSLLTSDAEYLARRVTETVRSPLPGVRPWHGAEVCRILEDAARNAPDHGAFRLIFMDGVRNLLKGECEDALFHHYVEQALLSEARISADSLTTRDHLTHVSQVFLLGWLVLNGTRTFASAPAAWCPYKWELDADARFPRLNRAWLYASLLHDCAYSVELSRNAIGHELRVGALYRGFFEVGNPGDADDRKLRAAAERVWKWRKRRVVTDAAAADLVMTALPRRATMSFQRSSHWSSSHA